MLTIRPFQAFRPKPELAKQVSCVPYDVIDTEEARIMAHDNSLSFLHVVRPEIDCDPQKSIYDDAVYEKGRENLNQFIADGVLIQDDKPSVYIYRLIRNKKSQTGVFCCVSVDDYDNGHIIRHELTRPDKEDDRTRHILSQSAHAEPVMLIHPQSDRLNTAVAEAVKTNPLFDFTAPDGVQHTIWKTDDASITRELASLGKIYIADGHHRCKSASRAAEKLRAEGGSADAEFNFFPAVIFPEDQMEILAYNRTIKQVSDEQWNLLINLCVLKKTGSAVPENKGEACFFYRNQWYTIFLPDAESKEADKMLDVARLQDGILEPVFGIADPRRDPNIAFVGGIRGTKELENLERAGKAQLGISLYPTSIAELMAVSDANLLMPPKSTWFEPKLRSGLLVHTF